MKNTIKKSAVKKSNHILGFIASDHRGYALKEQLKEKFPLIDLGTTNSETLVDEVDYADKLVKYILREKTKGILICGSGFGMAMSANRHKGIRAAVCRDVRDAQWSRMHTDCNVLVLAGEFTKFNEAVKIVDAFYKTEFLGLDRYKRRIKKLDR